MMGDKEKVQQGAAVGRGRLKGEAVAEGGP